MEFYKKLPAQREPEARTLHLLGRRRHLAELLEDFLLNSTLGFAPLYLVEAIERDTANGKVASIRQSNPRSLEPIAAVESP